MMPHPISPQDIFADDDDLNVDEAEATMTTTPAQRMPNDIMPDMVHKPRCNRLTLQSKKRRRMMPLEYNSDDDE